MTITEATHFIARRVTAGRVFAAPAPVSRAFAPPPPVSRGVVSLNEAMAQVEPGWVEAVAIVQAVCAQLAPQQAAPTLDQVSLAASGAVSFAATPAASDVAAVRGLGQLLNAVLRSAGCPMPVWDATERALRTPEAYGSARGFAAALTSVPADEGVRELQRYFRTVATPQPASARAALAAFGPAEAALR